MIRRSDNNRRKFYVVHFLELPFEGIDDYVCVPYTWVIVRNATNKKSSVAYPKKEDPFVTRDRVKNKEKCNNKWKFYMVTVEYETDNFEDAEYWIAMRNDNRPSVEGELKTTDIEPEFSLNKKWRVANRNHSSKLDDNPRKPLPKILIKRSSQPEPNKQLDGKRMKLDDAAQSSSAVVNNANAEPGSSRQEQSIIAQDNQTMESAQTATTTSDSTCTSSCSPRKDQNLQESLPIQEQQELSTPYINVATPDTPTLVIDEDEEVQLTSIKELQVPSYQAISQFTEQSKPVQQPRIVAAPSIEMTQKPVEKRIRLMNIKKNLEIAAQNQSNLMDQFRTLAMRSVKEQSSVTTQNQSQDGAQLQEMRSENSRKSTALLRSVVISSQKINDVPRINLKKTQNVNTVDPRNIVQSFTNVASASQNTLSSSLQRPSYGRQLDGQRRLLNQQQSVTQSYQNQCIPTNQNNFEQNLLRKSAERNNYEQRPNSRNITMSTPFIGQNSIISSSPLYQTSELPQQRQSHPSQQDSQLQKPKIRIGTSTKPQNIRQTPTVLMKIPLNSEQQAILTIDNQYLQNEQQFQRNHSERAPVNENHLNQIDNTLQTDEWMEEETLSAHHEANSDSDTITDHEVISDHEMSADEAPVERTNNFYGPGISSGSGSTDRPIAAQNSTIHQTHSKVVLKQQMLDHFATLFTQMGSTLRYTTDMYTQSSIMHSHLKGDNSKAERWYPFACVKSQCTHKT